MLIEYEGTRYHGFQIQINVPTIQEELERAIHKATGEAVRLYGAGRTDAGVHARGQVAAFESESGLPPETFTQALNFYLPSDIAIRDACQVERDFDPRRHAISRQYRYTILNSSTRSPLAQRWSYQVARKLDIGAMSEASEILLGEHDFAPFTNKEGGAKNTVRNVFKVQIHKRGEFAFLDIIANAFLPQQVRRTLGGLKRVGLGDMSVAEFHALARSSEVGKAKWAAPAHGLCLMRVKYSNIGLNDENV